MNQLILLAFLAFAAWLIRRDTAQRHGISRTLWIPTLWVGILTSRPLSAWLNLGGGSNTLEGSPLDRLFYLVIICISLLILAKRNVDWKHVITANWPIFLFYAYFLVSVSWADSPPLLFQAMV